MKIRVHVFVSGDVQGVFFRSETRRLAVKYNLKGWIRNLNDGRVEGVFEGDKDSVNELIGFCKKGPSGARVSNVELISEVYAGDYKEFRIVW
jgi:acylphosphatase